MDYSHLKFVVFLSLFLCFEVQSLEVVQIEGRVDRQATSQLGWSPALVGFRCGNNEVFRLQVASKAKVQDAYGFQMEIQGPAIFRVNTLQDPDGLREDLVFSEMEGLFHISQSGSELGRERFLCNSVAIHSLRGKGHFVCESDSSLLLAWMDQGQSTFQRGGGMGVTLVAGKTWRMWTVNQVFVDGFVDSAWAAAHVGPRYGAGVFVANKIPKIRWSWSASVRVPDGTNWQMGEYLENHLKAKPWLVENGDTLTWSLAGAVERFNIRLLEGVWIIDLRIRFQLQNRDMPLQNREILFERQVNLDDSAPNRYGLLRLLPLDEKNQKIKNSYLGTLLKELDAFLDKEVLNPFMRAGMKVE